MNTQWPTFAPLESRIVSAADARDRLAELKADMGEAMARVREVLEALAEKYDIPPKEVSYAIDGFADDMLAELVFGAERDLEQAIDDQREAASEGRS